MGDWSKDIERLVGRLRRVAKRLARAQDASTDPKTAVVLRADRNTVLEAAEQIESLTANERLRDELKRRVGAVRWCEAEGHEPIEAKE